MVLALVALVSLQVAGGWLRLTDPDTRNAFGDVQGWFVALRWNFDTSTALSLLGLASMPVLVPEMLSPAASRRLRLWGIPTALYVSALSSSALYWRLVDRRGDQRLRTDISIGVGTHAPMMAVALLAALLWVGEDRVKWRRSGRPSVDLAVGVHTDLATPVVEVDLDLDPLLD